MQERYFNNPRRNGSLGELQADQAAERGEYMQLGPGFAPPPANISAPGIGTNQANIALGENQSNWGAIPFTVGTTPVKIQDATYRKFMLIQNLSGLETLYFGFGWIPTTTFSLVLQPGEGFEPFRYPINDIYVMASAASTQGLLLFGV